MALVTLPGLAADTVLADADTAQAKLIEIISSAQSTAANSTLTVYRGTSAVAGQELWQVLLTANANGGSRVFSVLGKATIESGVGLFLDLTDWTGRMISVALYRSAT